MKKYSVVMCVNGSKFSMDVLARDEQVARNKAVRRSKQSLKCEVDHTNVESVEYLGFYLNRRFFPSHYVWINK